MKKLFLISSVILSSVFAFGKGPATGLSAGDAVPDLSIKMVDGSVIKMADLKGRVVVLNFWATWCPLCRAELARVDKEIVERFSGDDFAFIAISRGETRSEVERFRKMTNYQFRMGLDTDESLYELFDASGIPSSFVIDRDGKLSSAHLGYNNELFQQLITDIEKTLKKTK